MKQLYFVACVGGFIAIFGNRINAQTVLVTTSARFEWTQTNQTPAFALVVTPTGLRIVVPHE